MAGLLFGIPSGEAIAVRAGVRALTLAIILQPFDTFTAVADAVHQQGSLYQAIVQADLFVLGSTIGVEAAQRNSSTMPFEPG